MSTEEAEDGDVASQKDGGTGVKVAGFAQLGWDCGGAEVAFGSRPIT